MKKQIAFYIGWDIVFLSQLYLFSNLNIIVRQYVGVTMETWKGLWFQLFWMIVIGIIISILITNGNRYQINKKTAAIELAIVGIPALHIATMGGVFFGITNSFWARLTPVWLYHDSKPMMFCGILLGCEIYIFISRMIKYRRLKTVTDPAKPLDDA